MRWDRIAAKRKAQSKVDYIENWHPWYAWYPIKVKEVWYWLCRIERKREWIGKPFFFTHWEYKNLPWK